MESATAADHAEATRTVGPVMENAEADEAVAERSKCRDRKQGWRWERILPPKSLRILLVEYDDSTRQVVAALLRKCSYRVVAVADGMKAWEVLQEKSFAFDLVLTEVDMPSLSGIDLLSNIVAAEESKNIPVIMMSSQDSIVVVLKCMLKGAVDFLVKPVRKNELQNLWQHVWRRQCVISSDNTVASNCVIEGADGSNTGANSDDKKDTESLNGSKAEIEVESAHNLREVDANGGVSSVGQEGMAKKDSNPTKTQTLVSRVDEFTEINDTAELETENTSSEEKLKNGFVDWTSHEQHSNCFSVMSVAADPCKELNEGAHGGRELNCSASAKLKEKDVLNHSSVSAFSSYSTQRIRMLSQGSLSSPCGTSSGGVPLNREDEVADVPSSRNNGSINYSVLGKDNILHSSQVGFIPVPLSIGPITYQNICAGYGAIMQPMYYSEAPFRQCSLTTAENKTSQSVSDQLNFHEGIGDDSHTNDVRSLEDVQQIDIETGETDSPTVDGEDQGLENTSINIPWGQGCSDSGEMIDLAASAATTSENGNESDTLHVIRGLNAASSYREVALFKFRMKRKERCFEKKVRYHSRKMLAEQRPRIKGQFVSRKASQSITEVERDHLN